MQNTLFHARLRTAMLSTVSIMLACLSASAQDRQDQNGGTVIQLPRFSVTATKTEKSPEDVPATVSIVTAEEIENNFITDIKELVRFEPGVSVRSNPPRFTAALAATGRDGHSGFNIRGLEGNRVLMLYDGIRLPDSFGFGAQAVGRGGYADLGLLKRVEIMRGPASALYGSDGLSGVVSFTTKDPDDFLDANGNFQAQGRVAFSSADESWTEGVALAGRMDRWSALVAYDRTDAHEQDNKGRDSSANTDRTVPNPQDVQSNSVLAKLVFDASGDHRFRLTYDHLDSEADFTVLSAIAKPPLAATSTLGLVGADTTKRDRFSLDHRAQAPFAFADEIFWGAYYQKSLTTQFSAEDRNTAADRTRLNTFDNRVIGFHAQLESGFSTGAVNHRLLFGGDYSKTRQEGLRDGTIPPVGETFPTRAFPNTNYALGGLFVQDEIETFGGALTLYPAIRYDYYALEPEADAFLPAFVAADQSDSHISPKLGAVAKLTDTLRVFANYGVGFKAPSPLQVNNAFANPVMFYSAIPNPNLKPETSESIEGGIRVNTESVSASATAFSSRYKDFIDQVQVGGNFTPANPAVFQYVNLGGVRIHGIEGRLDARLGSGFTFLSAASYTHGDAVSVAGVETPLNSVDPVKLVAGLKYDDPSDMFGLQLSATHSEGKSERRVAQTCSTTALCFTPPGFTVWDFTAYWNVSEHATLRAGVFNIGDETYWWWSDVRGIAANLATRDAYTQPGRNFTVSLIVRN